ncbi:MAG: hypothetical protein J1F68_01020 [Clostridiales bacterium]|nr:hypothetical protein [Clostridiales bacterium]
MNKKTVDRIIDNSDTEELCNLIQNGNFLENIKELKSCDFLVDVRGTHKFNKLVDDILEKLQIKEAIAYLEEINIINAIFEECARLQSKIDAVPPNLILPLLLYWGSYNVEKYESAKAKDFFKGKHADSVTAYEKNAELTIQAIKSLIYNEKVYSDSKFMCSLNDADALSSPFKYKRCVMEYLINSYNVSMWHEKYNYWKKNIYGLEIINDKEVHLSILDKIRLTQYTSPYIKEKIMSFIYENNALHEYYFYIKPFRNLTPKVMEYTSQKILDKHFYCESADIEIKSVKIKYWIKAYVIIYKISQNNSNKDIVSFSKILSNHIYCKTKKQWINIFVKNGIPVESATIVFDNMILRKGATDLYDYPFIPINNKYAICLSITKWIHAARSVISRFNSQDINIDIKGHNFEKNLYRFLDLTKTPYVQMHHHVDREEYECDAVFYMNDTFVFCECKSRTGHELETRESVKYLDDVKQLNRIVSFYKNNMNFVFEAFEKKRIKIKSKKFYSIKSIVIHSGTVDGVIVKDDVYIMDFDNFILPFDRGTLFEDYVKIRKLKKVFEGEVNIYKLFKFYDCDFCIFNYRDKIVYQENQMSIGRYKLRIENYFVGSMFDHNFFDKVNEICLRDVMKQYGKTK